MRAEFDAFVMSSDPSSAGGELPSEVCAAQPTAKRDARAKVEKRKRFIGMAPKWLSV
jgi:hypothetical protein